ncbi:MAG: glycoside hydrolase family 2 protein [Lachnospiraceae bacterium]|nr:glycoside hydrolase family 2 protein [Lachnospiraceae bacterium]
MKITKLDQNWIMRDCVTDKTYPACVPGSVLASLIKADAIKDPYYGTNEYEIRDLFWQDYSFETSFFMDENDLNEEKTDLVFHGLDTLAEVTLNGHVILKSENMHRTYRVAVTSILIHGENKLHILFRSPLQFIKDYQYEEGKEITFVNSGSIPGNQLLRKSHSMLGWDWGAQLPDAGLFRDVELVGYSDPILEDVFFNQDHEGQTVKLRTKIVLSGLDDFDANNRSEKEYQMTIRLVDPEHRELSRETLDVRNETFETEQMISNPHLWWPNGLGGQPLYLFQLTFLCGEEMLWQKDYTIGLRTLTVSREKDEWGSEFAFMINGVKIFTKGANYIPEDCVYPNIDVKRLEYLTDCAVRANYNCLRIWGGGYYPSDLFYDLCDRKGLIIWQDFMFACNAYDVTDEFAENIVHEVIDNVRRLRHHACLGLWCGNNEIESAWVNWDGFKNEKPALKVDYIKLFEYILPKAVKEAGTESFFWPSSPSSGGNFDQPDDENNGDTHYWAVWHGLLPFSDYRKHFFRFCSEFGFQSFPSIKTVNTYTGEGDRNIFSKVMESHQKNDAANGKMLYYLSENFCYPKDFENLLYVTQILQACAIKYGVEHFRRNRGRCMGSLYWQMNDNWPVASWSSVDYFGRWKALHYFAKNFYESVAGSLMIEGEQAQAWIQNETLQSVSATVVLSLKTINFEIIHTQEVQTILEPLSAQMILPEDYHELMSGYSKDELICEMRVRYPDGKERIISETFVPYKHMKLSDPKISYEISEAEESFMISVKANSFAAFVELDLTEADAIFEDNYFNLSGNEPVNIKLEKADIWNTENVGMTDLESMLKIRSLYDTYQS